ncbi:MAG: fibronectin type III domain-containing protein [Candidatus Riflebacteria bacterium]|nr:fibronectin type III domain-containing protein [Candidatus Riflebacteria bacterium]
MKNLEEIIFSFKILITVTLVTGLIGCGGGGGGNSGTNVSPPSAYRIQGSVDLSQVDESNLKNLRENVASVSKTSFDGFVASLLDSKGTVLKTSLVNRMTFTFLDVLPVSNAIIEISQPDSSKRKFRLLSCVDQISSDLTLTVNEQTTAVALVISSLQKNGESVTTSNLNSQAITAKINEVKTAFISAISAPINAGQTVENNPVLSQKISETVQIINVTNPTGIASASTTNSSTGIATDTGTKAGANTGLNTDNGSTTGNKISTDSKTTTGTSTTTNVSTNTNAATSTTLGNDTSSNLNTTTVTGLAVNTQSNTTIVPGTGANTGQNSGSNTESGSSTGTSTSNNSSSNTSTGAITSSGTSTVTGTTTAPGTGTGNVTQSSMGTATTTGTGTGSGASSGTGTGTGAVTQSSTGTTTTTGTGSGTGSAIQIDNVAPIISSIVSFSISTSSASISWTTDEDATSQVEYGPTSSYGSTTEIITTLLKSHSINLSGLIPLTTYHYRVKSKDLVGNERISGDQMFATAALSQPNIAFFSSLISQPPSTLNTIMFQIHIRNVPTSLNVATQIKYGSSEPGTPLSYEKTGVLPDGIILTMKTLVGDTVRPFNQLIFSADLPIGAIVEIYNKDTERVITSTTMP